MTKQVVEVDSLTVVDGDTFKVEFAGSTETIRLANVGAPEKGTPNSRLATIELLSLLDGSSVIAYERHSIDRYGRWICDVWNADAVHVNDAMQEHLNGYFGR